MEWCKCTGSRKTVNLGKWDRCELEEGRHTQFFLERCKVCDGLCGFPQTNFELALEEGTVETKKLLKEMAVPK